MRFGRKSLRQIITRKWCTVAANRWCTVAANYWCSIACKMTDGDAAGSWGEEIWDTAMCVIALKEMGVSTADSTVQRAVDWIASLYSANGRYNWHDEPWETSWSLMALLRAGYIPSNINIDKTVRWLASLQTPDGAIISPHYTGYFVMINSMAQTNDAVPDSTRLLLDTHSSQAKDYLTKELQLSSPDRLWTGEAWSNGQILLALCLGQGFPIDDNYQVKKVVNWFAYSQNAKGGWSDVEDTASAILGLYALESLILRTYPIQSDESQYGLSAQLQRRSPTPRLRIQRRLLEFDAEFDAIVINLPSTMLKIAIAVIGFFVVGLVGWLADMIALIQAWYATIR